MRLWETVTYSPISVLAGAMEGERWGWHTMGLEVCSFGIMSHRLAALAREQEAVAAAQPAASSLQHWHADRQGQVGAVWHTASHAGRGRRGDGGAAAGVVCLIAGPGGVAEGSVEPGRTVQLACKIPRLIVGLNDVVFSGDSKLVLGADSKAAVRVWDVGSGRLRSSLTGHAGKVVSLDASRTDASCVVSAGADRTIKARRQRGAAAVSVVARRAYHDDQFGHPWCRIGLYKGGCSALLPRCL